MGRLLLKCIINNPSQDVIILNGINLLDKFGIPFIDQAEVIQLMMTALGHLDSRNKDKIGIICMEPWKWHPEKNSLPTLYREVPIVKRSKQITKVKIPILEVDWNIRNTMENQLQMSLHQAVNFS